MAQHWARTTAFKHEHPQIQPETQVLLGSLKPSSWGTWVALSVKPPTLAQIMISQFVGSTPASGSMLIAQSLESPSDSVSPSLSTPPMLTLCLSLSFKNK